ncbi:23333_t:CDS:1, partial [Entrophospora sp. SA101]
AEHNTAMGKQKRCNKCGKTEIENSQCRCPDCNEKLANIAEIQQEEADKSILETTNTTKPLHIKFYQNSANISDAPPINPISITQKSIPQDGVKMPVLFLPDPLPLNPNSIGNVRKVLDHIQEISGINKGERKWIPVVCDGVPYNYAQKIKEDYPRILM